MIPRGLNNTNVRCYGLTIAVDRRNLWQGIYVYKLHVIYVQLVGFNNN